MKIGPKLLINMKIRYILFVVAALALPACVRNTEPVELIEPEGQTITIWASLEGSDETRSTLQNGGTRVYWEPADEIKIFFKGSSGRFMSQNTENVTGTDFSGTISIVAGETEGGTASNSLWGLYPYRSDATSDGVSVTTTLPAEQTGRAGSFAKNTNITLAQSAGLNLAFYNVCGGVRFSLTQEGVKEVVFQGQNDEDIAGKVKVAFADGVPAVQEVIDGLNTITLTAPSGGTFETGKWYYIIALPGTLSNGFKMTFNTATQYATLKSSGSKTIKRGIFGSLADADEDLIYKDKEGGSEPNPDDFIQFADPIAKYACVEKFDENNDGEVSYAEAAAATSLVGLFSEWSMVTEFEEIRYFTSVISTEGVFSGLSHLKHITIPGNITTLGTFQSCTSLETVSLPAGLASLPTNCFDGCSSLKSVTLPTGITSIPKYAFRNCSMLQALVVPSTIKSVDQYAFYGCTVLSGIDLPLGLHTIDNYAFQNCPTIASVDFPSSLTCIGQYAFYGCTALGSVTIRNGVSLGASAFSGCRSLETATIGEHVSVGSGTFANCTALTSVVLPNSVSVGESAFSGCSSLVSVVLPEDMTSIPAYCFQYCDKLSSIVWPAELTTIDNYAFYGSIVSMEDPNASTIELPSTIKSIGSQAFWGVRHVIMPSTSAISIASDSFCRSFTRLYVPAGMVDMYKVRTNWISYAKQIYPLGDYPAKLPSPAPEAVDLGLSVKWASWNVGAFAAEGYGDYYAWGDTEPYYELDYPPFQPHWKTGKEQGYTWASYKWCNKGYYGYLTKYNVTCPSGVVDNKMVLDFDDDAAHVNWGGTWRMPTDAEWDELIENCSWASTSDYNGTGIAGRIATSKKSGYTDKSIFLPFAGERRGTDLLNVGSSYRYWSSSLFSGLSEFARFATPSGVVYGGGIDKSSRCCGFSIRPVCD